MKTLKTTSLSCLFALMLTTSMVACSQKNDVDNEEKQDVATELWAEYLFSDSNAAYTIITTCSEGEFMTKAMPNDNNLTRDARIGPQSSWVAYGKVCGKIGATAFYVKMTNIYGTGCFEIKASAEDAQGCRTMSHRPCNDRVN